MVVTVVQAGLQERSVPDELDTQAAERIAESPAAWNQASPAPDVRAVRTHDGSKREVVLAQIAGSAREEAQQLPRRQESLAGLLLSLGQTRLGKGSLPGRGPSVARRYSGA